MNRLSICLIAVLLFICVIYAYEIDNIDKVSADEVASVE